MTSRERVRKTLRRSIPDRVPLDIGGTESSTIHGIAYRRLRSRLGLRVDPVRGFDMTQQAAFVDEDVRKLFEADTMLLVLEPRAWRRGELPDGGPCDLPDTWRPVRDANGDLVVRNAAGVVTARMPKDGFYFEPAFAPLANVTEPRELDGFRGAIESFDWPGYADESAADFAARARTMHESTDLAVVANLCMHLLAAGQILRGFENFMVDLLAEKTLAHALLDRLTAAYMKRADDLLDRAGAGKHIDAMLLTDDLGTQGGPMLSPDTYREMILPYQRRLFAHLHSKTDAALCLHSCGSVHAFIPDLIDAGVDALNPVQVAAEGMDSKRLKREFGKDITFWGGGCNTQGVLDRGTPAEVAREVERRVRDFAPGGGFIFTQVHNIQPDVPPENVLAMVDAFKRVRDYA